MLTPYEKIARYFLITTLQGSLNPSERKELEALRSEMATFELSQRLAMPKDSLKDLIAAALNEAMAEFAEVHAAQPLHADDLLKNASAVADAVLAAIKSGHPLSALGFGHPVVAPPASDAPSADKK